MDIEKKLKYYQPQLLKVAKAMDMNYDELLSLTVGAVEVRMAFLSGDRFTIIVPCLDSVTRDVVGDLVSLTHQKQSWCKKLLLGYLSDPI